MVYYPHTTLVVVQRRVGMGWVHARLVEFMVTGQSNDNIALHKIFQTNNTFKNMNSPHPTPIPPLPRSPCARRGASRRRRSFPVSMLLLVFLARPCSMRE